MDAARVGTDARRHPDFLEVVWLVGLVVAMATVTAVSAAESLRAGDGGRQDCPPLNCGAESHEESVHVRAWQMGLVSLHSEF